jgi:hypothetical protein
MDFDIFESKIMKVTILRFLKKVLQFATREVRMTNRDRVPEIFFNAFIDDLK